MKHLYQWTILFTVLAVGCAQMPYKSANCNHSIHFRIADVPVYKDADGQALLFESGLMINADGAPDAYHPQNTGTENLKSAGTPGNWWGIATENGTPSGVPFIQSKDDPYPGYYVSQTALFDSTKDRSDPARYVNANEVPYIVLPKGHDWGVELGDLAMVINRTTGKSSPAIVADFGPENKLGEGSIALAQALGIDSNPRTGGIESNIAYVIFPGTGKGFPKSTEQLSRRVRTHFERWGGIRHVDQCL